MKGHEGRSYAHVFVLCCVEARRLLGCNRRLAFHQEQNEVDTHRAFQ